MKTLKLNQLNKQKLVESEMNAVKGGVFVPAEWRDEEQMKGCGSKCNDVGTNTYVKDMHSGIQSQFYS